jgi:hypothetical protein
MIMLYVFYKYLLPESQDPLILSSDFCNDSALNTYNSIWKQQAVDILDCGTEILKRHLLFLCIVYIYIYVCVCVCVCICVYIRVYIYVCVCMYICVRIYVYIYIYPVYFEYNIPICAEV